ncbi:MAG: hypothetical protein DSZ01_05060, partial [Gammaproteobacteria bacterium]
MRIFRLTFHNQGKVYQLHAEEVSQGELYGFIEIRGLLFNEHTSVVIDPAEERLKDEFIGAEHLFIAATMESQGDSAQILKEYGIDQEKGYQALMEVRGTHRVTDPRAESKYRALERYSIDLTQMAQEGKL